VRGEDQAARRLNIELARRPDDHTTDVGALVFPLGDHCPDKISGLEAEGVFERLRKPLGKLRLSGRVL
jgi:hypothetical protein